MGYLFRDDESYGIDDVSSKLRFSPNNNHKSAKNWIVRWRVPYVPAGNLWAMHGKHLNEAIKNGPPDPESFGDDNPQHVR
jgi:hypothetical protein